MRHRIFVGSSTEDLTLANAIQLNLSRQRHTVKVWDQLGRAAGPEAAPPRSDVLGVVSAEYVEPRDGDWRQSAAPMSRTRTVRWS